MITYWIAQGTLLNALWQPEWEGNPKERGCVCVCVCIYTYMHVCTYIYTHTDVYTHTETYISDQISCSVVSDSLRPHESQHAMKKPRPGLHTLKSRSQPAWKTGVSGTPSALKWRCLVLRLLSPRPMGMAVSLAVEQARGHQADKAFPPHREFCRIAFLGWGHWGPRGHRAVWLLVLVV